MVEIEQYIILALALSGTLGILGAASHHALSREGSMAIGALCIISLAAPIAAAIPELFDLPSVGIEEIEVVGQGGYKSTLAEAFARGAEAYIAEEYSLDMSEVEVVVSGFDECSMRAESVTVTLSGKAVLANITAIRETVLAELASGGGECKVVMDIEG